MMFKSPFASFSILVLAVGCASTSITNVNGNSAAAGAGQAAVAVGGNQTSAGTAGSRTTTGGLTAIAASTSGGTLNAASGGNAGASDGSTGGFAPVATGGSTNIATGGSTSVATGGTTAAATGGSTSIAMAGSTSIAMAGSTSIATGGGLSSAGTNATGGSIESGGGGARAGGTTSLGGEGGKPAAIRVLPLGDGITATTCYRAKLWQQLVSSGRTNFDFTGTSNSGDACNVSANYDKDNEGHAGYLASNVLQTGNTDLADWLTERPADIVLMQLGANDILNGVAQADIISAYDLFLSALRTQNSKVKVFIALIMPMSANKCASACAASVQALNDAISNWAPDVSTTASPVSVVDLYTNFDVTNTIDGIKPDETGSAWVANRWYMSIYTLIN